MGAEDQETDEKEARFNKQWGHVMAGLDRAVAWVKANKSSLRKGFSFYLCQKTGIRISLGFMADDDEAIQAIRELFRGKTARRCVNQDGQEHFVVVDAGLTFEWDIWHFTDRTKSEVTEVTV